VSVHFIDLAVAFSKRTRQRDIGISVSAHAIAKQHWTEPTKKIAVFMR
jgi:hypothetical protein